MKRREFITLVGGVLVASSTSLRGQESRPARLGYIWIGSKGSEHSTRDGMRQGLRDLGFVEGRDFVLEERYANSQLDRLPEIVAELVELRVSLILCPGNQVTRAAMEGTSAIPIVATTPDLLESHFVASLARPGGNVTGMSLTAGTTLSEKWLEILKETFPNVVSVAVLASTTSATSVYIDRVRNAANSIGIKPQYFTTGDVDGVDRALRAIEKMKPDGLIVESDSLLVSNRSKIIAFAAEQRLPAVYGNLDYMPDGGLMAYYTSIFDTWVQLAKYVGRILKGAKPAELPVQQATKFELVINLKAAKAAGFTISEAILLRADRVIE